MVEGALSPAYLAYANLPRKANASSNNQGVSHLQAKGQCKAQLDWRGKRYVLGYFNPERDAAQSFNHHALLIIGPPAPINEPIRGDSSHHQSR